jgi:hypothetical protein
MTYSEEDFERAARKAIEELGDSFSYHEYEEFAKGRDGIPSGHTLRRNYNTFNEFKEAFGLDTTKPLKEKFLTLHWVAEPGQYPRFTATENGEPVYVNEHRLLATLLVDDLEEMKGKVVHHINHMGHYDNRLDNLELLDPEEHVRYHWETDHAVNPLRGEERKILLEDPETPGEDLTGRGAAPTKAGAD